MLTKGSAFTVAVLASIPSIAHADNRLHPGTPTTDRPTVITLGIRWPVTGDDNFNARVTVRYRTGAGSYQDAMPLFRVHPELVADGGGGAVAEFAGSIFDLAPGTLYDIELTAHDPDGGDSMTVIQAATRPVPATDPVHPRAVPVTDVASLQTALAGAQPGDVITLAPGTYPGEFTLNASGTGDDPIVIRGADRDAVILDGGNAGGNVLAVEGSYTHVERLTLQHDNRALRFFTEWGRRATSYGACTRETWCSASGRIPISKISTYATTSSRGASTGRRCTPTTRAPTRTTTVCMSRGMGMLSATTRSPVSGTR